MKIRMFILFTIGLLFHSIANFAMGKYPPVMVDMSIAEFQAMQYGQSMTIRSVYTENGQMKEFVYMPDSNAPLAEIEKGTHRVLLSFFLENLPEVPERSESRK